MDVHLGVQQQRRRRRNDATTTQRRNDDGCDGSDGHQWPLPTATRGCDDDVKFASYDH